MPGKDASPTRRGDDDFLSGHRIAVVTNHPTHYRLPLFEALARRISEAGGELVVFFSSQSARSRPWLNSEKAPSFDHEFIGGIRVPIRRRMPVIPVGLGRRLNRFSPHSVLVGGFSPAVLPAVLRSVGNHATVGVWSGEVPFAATARSPLRRRLRRLMVRHAQFGIAYGGASATYLRSLDRRLPFVIGRNTSPVGPHGVAVGGTPRLITIGDLATSRKGTDILLDALALLPDLHCSLDVIGGGTLESELKHRARNDSRIKFHGALRPPETLRRLAAAAVFLFPSRFDVFGLAVVEAMGAGLPSIVSSRAGADADLCVDHFNSIVLDTHEARAWADATAGLCSDHSLRTRLGENARQTIMRRWTIDHAVDAMVAGFRLGTLQAVGHD